MKDKAGVHFIRIALNNEERRLIRMASANCDTSMAEYTKSSVLAAAAEAMKDYEPPKSKAALTC